VGPQEQARHWTRAPAVLPSLAILTNLTTVNLRRIKITDWDGNISVESSKTMNIIPNNWVLHYVIFVDLKYVTAFEFKVKKMATLSSPL